MEVPNDLLYTREHEWVRVKDSKGIVGITDFAQDQLGDVVFVEQPQAGTELTKDATFGVVESVKTVSDLFAPVSGKVTVANTELEAKPELVNSAPYGDGWIVEIEITDTKELDDLLTPEAYTAFIQEQEQD
ncbi:MAG: glycine cleavage system protein GcvH [Candidatus Nitronauta litoralis]|uniref:Glycine cleavage system H protein n=1 Tax=Candidatus Nitronauta litoralis TaxID=2705533 RepID=A0A7T0G0V5_9BACT|nr:MAG: glycine cleavage system protein GcvH [Candidatus Nitronauta litoralis]